MAILIAIVVGLSLVGAGLWDAFETIVLPRRVSRRVRIASLFYELTWRPYAAVASRVHDETRRETFLSFYGPLSLIILVGVWAVVLVVGFAVLQWAAGSGLSVADGQADFVIDLAIVVAPQFAAVLSGQTLHVLQFAITESPNKNMKVSVERSRNECDSLAIG